MVGRYDSSFKTRGKNIDIAYGSSDSSVAGEMGCYSMNLFSKAVVKTDDIAGTSQPLDYLMDLSTAEPARCCTGKAFRY